MKVPAPFECKHNQILHSTAANPSQFHSQPYSSYQLCFKVFSCIFIFISLSLFDCVSLNNVAILYKKPLCICLKILSSWLSPSLMCSSSHLLAPLALTPLLSSSLILPLAVSHRPSIIILSQSAHQSQFLDLSCPLGWLMNLPAPLDPSKLSAKLMWSS